MGAPDRLLSSTVAHLQATYAVDVIGAIVAAQAAALAMRAADSGTILVTGAGSPTTDPGPGDRVARQGGSAVGRDHAWR